MARLRGGGSTPRVPLTLSANERAVSHHRMGPLVSTRLWGVALAVVSFPGCEAPRREIAFCRCTYLTDTDVPGVQEVEVCSEWDGAQNDGEARAAECAGAMGVGHVERCACSFRGRSCAKDACGHVEEPERF